MGITKGIPQVILLPLSPKDKIDTVTKSHSLKCIREQKTEMTHICLKNDLGMTSPILHTEHPEWSS